MLCFRSVVAGVFILGSVSASLAHAQNAVPGGWDNEVGVQSFSGPQFPAGSGVFRDGTQAFGSPVYLAACASGTPFPLVSLSQTQPQVVNSLLPLADTVRRHTRRRSGR